MRVLSAVEPANRGQWPNFATRADSSVSLRSKSSSVSHSELKWELVFLTLGSGGNWAYGHDRPKSLDHRIHPVHVLLHWISEGETLLSAWIQSSGYQADTTIADPSVGVNPEK